MARGVQVDRTKTTETMAYFDGVDDYLTVPDADPLDLGTGDFSIDFWMHTNSAGSVYNRGSLIGVEVNTSGLIRAYTNNGISHEILSNAGTDLRDNTWHHVAFVRQNNTLGLFVDGVQQTNTEDDGGQNVDNATDHYIGANSTPGNYFRGYIDEFRISNIARWNINRAPTAPSEPTTDVVLLLHNDGDASSGSHNVNTVGTPILKSKEANVTTFKGSMYFNGSTDYLTIPDSDDFTLSMASDWTIDFWLKDGGSVDAGYLGTPVNNADGWCVRWDSTNTVGLGWGNGTSVSRINFATIVKTENWMHFAFVNNGGKVLFFVDGILTANDESLTGVANGGDLNIGRVSGTTGGFWNYVWYYKKGYIDELRITKGLARWTTNFIPDTSPPTPDTDVVLILNSDTNTLIEDSSPRNHTIGVSNDAKHSIEQAKFGASSLKFDGDGDYLTIPDSADWNFGKDDFTIECWMNLADKNNDMGIFAQNDDAVLNFWWFEFDGVGDSYGLRFRDSVGGYIVQQTIGSASGYSNNTWYHIAVVRENNEFRLYLDGSLVDSAIYTGFIKNIAEELTIGKRASIDYFNGYLDEIRISNIARYTTNFTPDTSPFTSDSSTLLLIHSSSNVLLTDTASPNRTLTSSGDASHLTFPRRFGNSSIYFDGNGDYLSIPNSTDWDFGSGDFTIDYWLNNSNTAQPNRILSKYDTGTPFFYFKSDGAFYMTYTGGGNNIDLTALTGESLPPNNSWYHMAFVKQGSVFSRYVNGILQSQITGITGTMQTIDSTIYLGIAKNGTSTPYNGYLDDFRISKGIARWSTNFHPPTRSHTADEYTVLLITSDVTIVSENRTFTDTSPLTPHPITAYGDTHHVLSKFGDSSLYFDGVDDYISVPYSEDWDFGTNDFTIDFWVNRESTGYILARMAGGTDACWQIGINGSNQVDFTIYHEPSGSTSFASTKIISANTWTHVACLRENGMAKIYIDGELSGDQASTGAVRLHNIGFTIGAREWGGWSYFKGAIDALRITKGRALWSSNFTPSSNPYTSDTYTKLLMHMDGDVASFNVNATTPTNDITFHGGAQIVTGKKWNGSYYFDGSDDYLEIADSDNWDFGSGDFTIDFWMKYTLVGSANFIGPWATGALSWTVQYASNVLYFYYSTNGTNSSSKTFEWTPINDTWYHIAIQRKSNDLSALINGSLIGTTESLKGITLFNSTTPLYIGANATAPYFNGYMDEIRIVKGRALFESGFNPATNNYTSDAYTKLLLHMNNDNVDATNFVDEGENSYTVTRVNDTIQISGRAVGISGNVHHETDQKKFGQSSLFFDGVGDYIELPDSDDWDFGNGDFTIDCWIKLNNTAGDGDITTQYIGGNYWTFRYNTSGANGIELEFSGWDNLHQNSGGWDTNWHHVALVRWGNKWALYKDGKTVANYEGAGTMPNSTVPLTIGGGLSNFNGYIDELRITKGRAIWKKDFRVPNRGN